MSKFDKSQDKLDKSQDNTFTDTVMINGKPVVASVDRDAGYFEGVAFTSIDVEVANHLLPFGTTIDSVVDIGDKPRVVRGIANDGRHTTLSLDTTG